MKVKPILMSAPMVLAILDGSKTQTRRICKPAEFLSECVGPFNEADEYDENSSWFGDAEGDIKFQCPHGKPGDLLWVRENLERANEGAVGYPADCSWLPNTPWQWKRNILPSIHMPRWASRITLEITNVRVERLQSISEQDAIAEGIEVLEPFDDGDPVNYGNYQCGVDDHHFLNPKDSFQSLWQSINGKDSWKQNPWVWVVEFKVHRCNVDDYLRKGAA